MSVDGSYEQILQYWFGDAELAPHELTTQRLHFWFSANPDVDSEIRSRFGRLIEEASADRLGIWEYTPRPRLALILLLDQFRRNVFRESREAFSCDSKALKLCRVGLALGMDHDLSVMERAFFYMPLQHAEDLSAQQLSVELFRSLKDEGTEEMRMPMAEFLASAKAHHAIIDRFGRFPHRNVLLGRDCTADELRYLVSERIPFKK
jgi:uncharacterized protein (DUF924 family)